MAQQVFGVLRHAVAREICRRAHHDEAERFGEPHLYHVALDGRALAHACVESLGYDIDEPLLDRDLDFDSRVPRAERRQHGLDDERKRHPRHRQPDAADDLAWSRRALLERGECLPKPGTCPIEQAPA